MLSLAMIEHVQRLLESGEFSQRAISRMTGVSRGTIGDLVSGKRGIYGKESCGPEEPALGPPVRCPGCGGMVFEPCLYCQTIAYMEELHRRQNRRRPCDPTDRRAA